MRRVGRGRGGGHGDNDGGNTRLSASLRVSDGIFVCGGFGRKACFLLRCAPPSTPRTSGSRRARKMIAPRSHPYSHAAQRAPAPAAEAEMTGSAQVAAGRPARLARLTARSGAWLAARAAAGKSRWETATGGTPIRRCLHTRRGIQETACGSSAKPDQLRRTEARHVGQR